MENKTTFSKSQWTIRTAIFLSLYILLRYKTKANVVCDLIIGDKIDGTLIGTKFK